jgi:lipopolysaccharide exporter
VVNIANDNGSELASRIPKKSGKKGGFLNDVLKISFGTTFAQVLLVIIAPILTRLFSPEAFGVAALFISLSTIIGGIVSLKYELSIILPETDEEAANLLVLSLIVTTLISAATYIFIVFTQSYFIKVFNIPELGPYLIYIPLCIFFLGFGRILTNWYSRKRQYGKLSFAKILNSIMAGSSQLSAGFLGLIRSGGLIFPYILGWVVFSLFLAVYTWIDNSKLFIESIHWKKIIAGLIRYKKFPLLSSISALLNSLSAQSPVLLLAFFFSSVEVGFYALGHRVLKMPVELIGVSVAQVFYQRASDANREGKLAIIVDKVFFRLVSLGMFPLLLVMVFGRDLFIVALGENWAEAGVYMQILALWTFFVFISNPISTLVNTLEKQEMSLLFNVFIVITRVSSLIIGGLLGSVYLALILFSISGVISWMWFCFWLLLKSGLSLGRILNIFGEFFLLSFPFLLISAYVTYFTSQSSIVIILAGGLCTLFYYVIVFGRDKELFSYGVDMISKYWGYFLKKGYHD